MTKTEDMTVRELLDANIINKDDCDLSSVHLQDREFDNLTEAQKSRLIRWISRISERAYRRGVQQTLQLSKDKAIKKCIVESPHSYRYENCLDISEGLDGYITTSIERLKMEEDMFRVGLYTTSSEVYSTRNLELGNAV